MYPEQVFLHNNDKFNVHKIITFYCFISIVKKVIRLLPNEVIFV